MSSAIDITNVSLFLLSLPVTGAGVVLIAQLIKKGFGMNSGKAIHTMVILVTIAGAAVSYILKFKGLPLAVLGISSPAMYGFSQGLYKGAIYASDILPKVSNLLYKVSNLFSKKPASTPAADAAVAAVAVPPVAASEPAASATTEFSL
jgi:hypothetical protein